MRGLSPEILISRFINGLRETVKLELVAKSLRTMIETMKLAVLEEEKAIVNKKGEKYNSTKNYVSSSRDNQAKGG